MEKEAVKKPLNYTKIQGKKAKVIDTTSFDIEKFESKIEEMKRSSDAHKGMGLASVQIGIEESILVVKRDPKDEHYTSMFNPKIIQKSAEMVMSYEGCLSIPGIGMPVKRHKSIEVEFFDGEKQKVEKAEGIFAIALQHEIAHLEGRTLFDDTTLNREEKRRLLKKSKHT